MRLVLDAMGSDHHPRPEVEAAVRAARQWPEDVIYLVGQRDQVLPLLEPLHPPANLRFVHAPEVFEMTDKPGETVRRKPNTSMAVGMRLVKEGEADAFVTAGNTGGALANALFLLGRIRGVRRPGLIAPFPTRTGGQVLVIDVGANAECKPEYLVQFAHMGSVYAQFVLGVARPRVGLLSNGEEAGKGNDLVKATYPLLAESGLHFIGNVEPKETFGGEVDVVVTDGFTGNVFLKTSEAVAKLLTDVLKEQLLASPRTKLGALLAKPAFDHLKAMLDPRRQGAVPLLGINGLVFVGHGRSDADALFSALRSARRAVASQLLERLREAIAAQLPARKKGD
ncbi:MAG: phosphate acyltransferase PlsX [Chloroflexi bacterium]|nr:phosphate acyltransferase PlsX [Chloroflexota bacterium]